MKFFSPVLIVAWLFYLLSALIELAFRLAVGIVLAVIAWGLLDSVLQACNWPPLARLVVWSFVRIAAALGYS